MRALALVALLVACGPPAADEGPWGAQKRSQGGKYLVAMAFEPEAPAMSELFVARATVVDPAGAPVEDATVRLDALMPHHGHGMMTAPRPDPGACDAAGQCVHPGGVYRSSGFKFHMGGPWTVVVEITGPAGPDDVSFIYEMPL